MQLRTPWDSDPLPDEAPVSFPVAPPAPRRWGRPPAALARSREAAASPAWLYRHLTVSGPAEGLARFAAAARGAGVIPWRLDLTALEEDVFNLAASQPPHLRSLGHDVFARGQPELLGAWTETDHEVDVIEFLWANLALFDDGTETADTATLYRPAWLALHSVPGARTRILRLLAETPEGRVLTGLLPEAAEEPGTARSVLRRRSAWASTFAASLELARQGNVVLAQEEVFSPIRVSAAGEMFAG